MPILDIVTIPNPILKQVSLPVEKIDYKIKNLVANMRETMLSSSHCVGIAAVQVGVLLRIVLVDISLNPKPH
ncbi:MAG: peptide deformylase, partial [Elusimicrobia bacterium]|nr:peptide deformylase [Elusimicrobiota bacterium]